MNTEVFLTAHWDKLIMANYKIDPCVLKPYLPAGTELDFWNGECYVSLVGFMFRDVRVKGMAIPFHINFPEVNLRFYVRRKDGNQWKRGVVFISEIVPKPAISLVANTLFKENYSTLPMKHDWYCSHDGLHVGYQWRKSDTWNKLEVTVSPAPEALKCGSFEEFITQHFWGYARAGRNNTVEYQVEHERWGNYKVKQFRVSCDFAKLYGREFGFLSYNVPESVFLADGSPVKVYSKKGLSISF